MVLLGISAWILLVVSRLETSKGSGRMLLLYWLLRLFGLVRGFSLRSSFGCFFCPLFRVSLFVPSSCFGTDAAVWVGRTDVLRHAVENGWEKKMYCIGAKSDC